MSEREPPAITTQPPVEDELSEQRRNLAQDIVAKLRRLGLDCEVIDASALTVDKSN